jgi:peptidoglycan-associated lipoprotein
MSTRVVSAALLAAALSLAACANKEVVRPASSAANENEPTSSTTLTAATQRLGVSNDIMDACHIDLGNVDRAPKFDFDQSQLEPSDRAVLDQVAQCFTTGPLKDKSLKLVGRADPRGEQEYNMTLGSYRAASVETYLNQLGLAPSRVTATSRGKLDATGTDESGWRLDRRVDLLLAGTPSRTSQAR